MTTYVYINRGRINSNRKHKRNDPPISASNYKGLTTGHSLHIDGPCEIVYQPDKPLSSGARVFIKTQSKVTKVK